MVENIYFRAQRGTKSLSELVEPGAFSAQNMSLRDPMTLRTSIKSCDFYESFDAHESNNGSTQRGRSHPSGREVQGVGVRRGFFNKKTNIFQKNYYFLQE